jgi:GTP-binding protein HflX
VERLTELPRGRERAVLVHLDLLDPEAREEIDELRALTLAARLEPVRLVTGVRRAPDARYFIGLGKAEEAREAVQREGAEIVVFNHDLSPSQQRNLERLLQCPVVDRTGLILDIFAQRARSFEGKLQVELAQLQHLSTRLVRGWTHLERQRGGIGLRGPGETQLETDRRLIAERIKQIHKRLARVQRQREQGRKSREKAELPTVSIVGYTNVGKSTLFNRLTGAGVWVADQLFATLDPTVRRVELAGTPPFILTDTVGFIRHLPHDLVAAFRATLEETREAGLLVHVIDAADPYRRDQVAEVNEVLRTIGADTVPQLEVYNKVDRMAGATPHIERDDQGRPRRIWLSAARGEGLDLLQQALAEHFSEGRVRRHLRLPLSAGRLRAQLFDMGAVRGEHVNTQGEWEMDIELDRGFLDRLRRDFPAHLAP